MSRRILRGLDGRCLPRTDKVHNLGCSSPYFSVLTCDSKPRSRVLHPRTTGHLRDTSKHPRALIRGTTSMNSCWTGRPQRTTKDEVSMRKPRPLQPPRPCQDDGSALPLPIREYTAGKLPKKGQPRSVSGWPLDDRGPVFLQHPLLIYIYNMPCIRRKAPGVIALLSRTPSPLSGRLFGKGSLRSDVEKQKSGITLAADGEFGHDSRTCDLSRQF